MTQPPMRRAMPPHVRDALRNSATALPALGQAAPYRWYVYAACTILAIALNYVFGKEMASDLLQYHFYSGFSALNDRFDQDYFAAGPQSYFNPYAYVPFYVLVKLGLPGLAVGTVLAVIHSVVLWLTYELACRVCPSEHQKERFLFGLCATILAFMNPVLLQQIGSSFADITTTVLVLGGWLLLVQAVRAPRTRPIVFGAILLGLATALKPTNGIHALAGFILVAFVPLPLLGRLRSLFYFGAALGASFVVTAAPWSYRLARMFGNPVFPLMNNIFKSPDISTAPAKAYRFIPDSLTDALLRPFAMSGTGGMIHEELSSPGHPLRPVAHGFFGVRHCSVLAVRQTRFDSCRNSVLCIFNPRARPRSAALSPLIGSYG